MANGVPGISPSDAADSLSPRRHWAQLDTVAGRVFNCLMEDISTAEDQAFSACLPLPLTPWEMMMHAEDQPDYPMISVIELNFSGGVERHAMNAALHSALARAPLLRACIRERPLRRPQWILAEELPEIHWMEAGTPLAGEFGARIDLQAQAGIRIWARHDAQRVDFHLELHHCCCDGVGVFQFIEDVLVDYANRTAIDGPALPLRRLDAGALKSRGNHLAKSDGPRQWLSKPFLTAREGYNFGFRRPRPLAADSPADTDGPAVEAFLVFRDDGGLLRRLRQAAAQLKVTLNDLLLRDLFLAVRQWNAAAGREESDDVIKIAMPCNLHAPAHAATPAANIMSYAFLTRRAPQLEDQAKLLGGIRQETESIRDTNAALCFLGVLGLASRVPGAMKFVSDLRACFATAVLSMLGDPTRGFFARFPRCDGRLVVGNLVLDGIAAWPPVRPHTAAGLVVSTYADRLTIALKRDRQTLSGADATKFLDLYKARLGARTLYECAKMAATWH